MPHQAWSLLFLKLASLLSVCICLPMSLCPGLTSLALGLCCTRPDCSNFFLATLTACGILVL